MHTGTEPTIEQHGYRDLIQEPAVKIGSHLYVASMVLPGIHTYEEVRIDQTSADKSSQIIGEIEEKMPL
eukprot:359110-Amphidinium_carterae.1